jgi:hypothetical protein
VLTPQDHFAFKICTWNGLIILKNECFSKSDIIWLRRAKQEALGGFLLSCKSLVSSYLLSYILCRWQFQYLWYTSVRYTQTAFELVLYSMCGINLIVGFSILLCVYPQMLFLRTTICNNISCARFYCALHTTCFGPDWWPSSGNTYIKYTKATTEYVNGPAEIAA